MKEVQKGQSENRKQIETHYSMTVLYKEKQIMYLGHKWVLMYRRCKFQQ